MTNVRLVKRVWTRPIGATGVGKEQPLTVLSPWIAQDGKDPQRLSLKIDLTGVPRGRATFWHDCVWYHFHNRGKFKSYAHFRKALQYHNGYRVDHVGGMTEITDLHRLRLIAAHASDKQGPGYRKWYNKSGARHLTQRWFGSAEEAKD